MEEHGLGRGLGVAVVVQVADQGVQQGLVLRLQQGGQQPLRHGGQLLPGPPALEEAAVHQVIIPGYGPAPALGVGQSLTGLVGAGPAGPEVPKSRPHPHLEGGEVGGLGQGRRHRLQALGQGCRPARRILRQPEDGLPGHCEVSRVPQTVQHLAEVGRPLGQPSLLRLLLVEGGHRQGRPRQPRAEEDRPEGPPAPQAHLGQPLEAPL